MVYVTLFSLRLDWVRDSVSCSVLQSKFSSLKVSCSFMKNSSLRLHSSMKWQKEDTGSQEWWGKIICPMLATERLHEANPKEPLRFWPKEKMSWSIGKTITFSQWQQTWRRNRVRPLSRDGTRSDVPLTKSHNQNAPTDTMSTWVVLTFTTYRFQDTISRSGLRSLRWLIFAWYLYSALINSHIFTKTFWEGPLICSPSHGQCHSFLYKNLPPNHWATEGHHY